MNSRSSASALLLAAAILPTSALGQCTFSKAGNRTAPMPLPVCERLRGENEAIHKHLGGEPSTPCICDYGMPSAGQVPDPIQRQSEIDMEVFQRVRGNNAALERQALEQGQTIDEARRVFEAGRADEARRAAGLASDMKDLSAEASPRAAAAGPGPTPKEWAQVRAASARLDFLYKKGFLTGAEVAERNRLELLVAEVWRKVAKSPHSTPQEREMIRLKLRVDTTAGIAMDAAVMERLSGPARPPRREKPDLETYVQGRAGSAAAAHILLRPGTPSYDMLDAARTHGAGGAGQASVSSAVKAIQGRIFDDYREGAEEILEEAAR